MHFRTLELNDIEALHQLILTRYEHLMENGPLLHTPNYQADILSILTSTASTGFGIVAVDAEKISGFLSFYAPIMNFFGNVKGAFSPLGANYATDEKLLTQLLDHAFQKMLPDEILQYGMSVYSSDVMTGQALSMNGFGIRCCDAVRPLSLSIAVSKDSRFRFQEVPKSKFAEIYPLAAELQKHLHKSPTFFPIHISTENEFLSSKNNDASRFFSVKYGNEIIAFLELTTEGETFISQGNDYLHICGAYVKPAFRGQSVPDQLLSHVIDQLAAEGYTRLGVDFETINPSARRFWLKHFDPYTFSYVRRLDERAIHSPYL